MLKLLLQLIKIQFKTFFRQPDVIFWAFIFPLVLLFVLGIAFDNKKAFRSSIGIVGDINFQIPIKNIEQVSKTIGRKIIIIATKYKNEESAVLAMKRGEISLYIAKNKGKNQYFFDPQNSEAQKDYLLIQKLLTYRSIKYDNVIELQTQGTRYIDFFLPGLLAFNILSSCFWGIGWSYIELRMKKYLKRLTATPMSKFIFLSSYIVTRLIISAFEVSIFIIFSYFVFKTVITGSIFAFAFMWLVGNLSFAGIAVLLGSRATNPITGNGLINAFLMPMILFSGIFFSYHNFPKQIIPIIKILPLTILADSFRAIFNEGAGFITVFPAGCLLFIIGSICFYIGYKIFKWY